MSKCIIITGCSGDIGKSLVNKFLDDDYTVIALDKEDTLNIKNKKLSFFQINLFDYVNDSNMQDEFNSKILDKVSGKFSHLVLINNAATQIVANINDITLEDIKKSIYINSISPFYLSRFVAKTFKGALKIINIGSIHSNQTKKGFCMYAGSKSLLESFSRSLSIELTNTNLSVLHVNPGAIDTQMLKKGFKDKNKLTQLRELIPAKYIPSTYEFAEFISTLCKLETNYLTGTIIDYSGGIKHLLSDTEN